MKKIIKNKKIGTYGNKFEEKSNPMVEPKLKEKSNPEIKPEEFKKNV